MTRYEREEWIGGWQSLYHSDDLEDAVRYVKRVHANGGNQVRVTQIPGRQGTISETVFEIPERAAFLPCPHCGSTSVELKESKAVHSYHFRVSCLSCADEGFEVAVGGRYVGDGKYGHLSRLDQLLEAQASAIFAWNRRASIRGKEISTP